MQMLSRFVQDSVSDWGWTQAAALEIKPNRRLTFVPKTVLVFLWGHWAGDENPRNVAKYAVPKDYHSIVGAELETMIKKLQPAFSGEQFAGFCDASPVPEVEAAVRAGLGERGRHNLLIHPRLGTRLHIGEIVTTLELPKSERGCEKLCSDCGRCKAACPTGALNQGFVKEKCQSHRTQQKGVLSEETQAIIRKTGIVWGCDICADACPWNKNPALAKLEGFYTDRVPVVTVENAASLCKTHAYGWRGVEIMLRNLKALSRL